MRILHVHHTVKYILYSTYVQYIFCTTNSFVSNIPVNKVNPPKFDCQENSTRNGLYCLRIFQEERAAYARLQQFVFIFFVTVI